MTISVEILSALDLSPRFRAEWDALVKDDVTSLSAYDATATSTWFAALIRAFPEASGAKILVGRDGGQVVGILPIMLQRRGRLGVHLQLVQELYCGRCGPILAPHRPDVAAGLLASVSTVWPGWLSLQMTLLDGADSTVSFLTAATDDGYSGVYASELRSPYFPLLNNAVQFNAGISKSVRQMLRTSRNKFQKEGETYFRMFTEPATSKELSDTVMAIERKSWKHAAGSAISRQPQQESFYRAFFDLAMEEGILLSSVLYLNGDPIAYNFGLARDGVFSCLKHSHDETYDKLSPSYLVNESLINELRSRGVSMFDFMGEVDAHKLRWSDNNQYYVRRLWSFANRSAKAKLVRLIVGATGKIRRAIK